MTMLDSSTSASPAGDQTEQLPEDDWRGVAAEKADEISASGGLFLRSRSRRLLGSLLRPHRRDLAWATFLIVVVTAAEMVGPYLVSVGIDSGIPAIRRGDWAPIGAAVAASHRILCSGGHSSPTATSGSLVALLSLARPSIY